MRRRRAGRQPTTFRYAIRRSSPSKPRHSAAMMNSVLRVVRRRACKRSSRDRRRRSAALRRPRERARSACSARPRTRSRFPHRSRFRPARRRRDSAQTRRFERLPSAAMSNALSRLRERFGDHQRRIVRRDRHAVRKVNVVRHLPGDALRRDHRDDAGRERIAGPHVEAAAVDVSIAARVYDDFVPTGLREGATYPRTRSTRRRVPAQQRPITDRRTSTGGRPATSRSRTETNRTARAR